ncbi:MAG TPA: sigma-70 family RNA polymerase sigma factor [Gemmataceae bacterium]|nr:sigma-70 family RNA polymerase sigma factor [Gemmataceae bacterium]
MVPLPTTRFTLLAQLRQNPSDQAGWDEFVERYGRHIYRWCRQWNLQDADAEDVTQDILVKLTHKLRAFAYDPSRSFRGWLKTVTHHAWRDFKDSRRPGQSAGGDGKAQDKMLTLEAREDLTQRLEGAYDLELLDAAKARVRLRIAPHTWEAFQLAAIDGLPVADVAARVGLQVAMVYVAKSKVQKMLQEEIAKLETDCERRPNLPS